MELQAAEKEAEELLSKTFDDSDNEDYNEEADKNYQRILKGTGKRKKTQKKNKKELFKKVRKKKTRHKPRKNF